MVDENRLKTTWSVSELSTLISFYCQIEEQSEWDANP